MTLAEKLKKILANPILWIENFCTIVDKQNKKVKFKLNPQQKQLVNDLDKYNIVLKSRQLGITSVSCGLSLYYAFNTPNCTCFLISYSLDSASQIFDKLKQLYEDLPSAIKLKDTANNKTMLKFDNGSKIVVTTCGSKEIGRGASIKYAHFSEMAFMKQDMIRKQLLAIEQALLPNGKIVIESTANGMNEFSNIWEEAEKGESLYKPFFFSWIEDKLMFKEEYKQFRERYITIYGHELTNDELTQDELIYKDMGATLLQLMWRRIKVKNSSEEQFKQEFPATPIEAFITSGNNLFNLDKIQQLYVNVSKVKPLKAKDIPTLPSLLKPYINSYLSVYEPPTREVDYFIGVDGSEGTGQDYSVIEVINKEGMQVCQFRSNKVAPHEVAKVVNELGLWYNRALIVVEKASGGHVILDRLVHNFKYKNLYKYKDYDAKGRVVKKVGFNTTSKSKPLLINNFVELFDNNDIYIKSIDLLNEMKTYVYTDGVKMGNGNGGKHDDTVIAFALAIEGMNNGIKYRW